MDVAILDIPNISPFLQYKYQSERYMKRNNDITTNTILELSLDVINTPAMFIRLVTVKEEINVGKSPEQCF
jgi:hypothetical protein